MGVRRGTIACRSLAGCVFAARRKTTGEILAVKVRSTVVFFVCFFLSFFAVEHEVVSFVLFFR